MTNRSINLNELRKVKGIGPKAMERINNHLDKLEGEKAYVSKYNPEIHISPNDLIHGDMLEVMNGIPDKSVDIILTDLPYGTTACSWDEIIPFDKLWKQYHRVIKDNGAMILFGNEPFSTMLRHSNVGNYKYDWIWVKERGTGFARSRKQPMRKHENISVFYKQQPKYDSQGEKLDEPYTHALPIYKSDSDSVANMNLTGCGERIYRTYTHATKHSVLNFAREHNVGNLHPTQKPVALLEYLIKTYTNEGDVVLDSTMGSGSTGVAAKNTNRRFIGIELDEEYYNIAKERIEKADKGDLQND